MHISKCVDDYNIILNLEPYSLVMLCLHRLVLLHHEMVGHWVFLFAKILIYLAFQYFDIKRIWWGLPQKCVVCTKLDIYVFISNNLTTRCVIEYDTKYCILLYDTKYCIKWYQLCTLYNNAAHHHFFRNACTKSGSLRFSQFSGCWLILSVYIIMSLDFPFVRLFGVR